ncbi:MAG: hypothetical protein IJV70_04665 [Clostridia bacterium]|nr:hypothetical protein [Clostridia bacterium]
MEMIGIICKIDSTGRLLIPKHLREDYGLTDKVELVLYDEGIMVRDATESLKKIEKKNNK